MQGRINSIYLDKLGGKITEEYLEIKNIEFRTEQARIQDRIMTHQVAESKYKEHGIAVLKFAKMPYGLYLR